ncbi:MAG: transcriptional regulator/antitoxin, MazE [Dehalococcoidia bacterium]|nr:transcriptional regulator/antitoxin, MazE [Dehalococcoidia bacterium]
MQSRIQKWGNSLALRIPKAFAREIGLDRGMPVDVSLEDGRLVVAPIIQSRMTLEQLLEQITQDNVHHEVDAGPAVGEEVW